VTLSKQRLDDIERLLIRIQERVSTLERVSVLECKVPDEIPRPRCYKVFRKGDRVAYCHVDSCSQVPKWYGIVIPRPAGCPAIGKQGPIVWVMKDGGTHDIVGCYCWNLDRA